MIQAIDRVLHIVDVGALTPGGGGAIMSARSLGYSESSVPMGLKCIEDFRATIGCADDAAGGYE